RKYFSSRIWKRFLENDLSTRERPTTSSSIAAIPATRKRQPRTSCTKASMINPAHLTDRWKRIAPTKYKNFKAGNNIPGLFYYEAIDLKRADPEEGESRSTAKTGQSVPEYGRDSPLPFLSGAA